MQYRIANKEYWEGIKEILIFRFIAIQRVVSKENINELHNNLRKTYPDLYRPYNKDILDN